MGAAIMAGMEMVGTAIAGVTETAIAAGAGVEPVGVATTAEVMGATRVKGVIGAVVTAVVVAEGIVGAAVVGVTGPGTTAGVAEDTVAADVPGLQVGQTAAGRTTSHVGHSTMARVKVAGAVVGADTAGAVKGPVPAAADCRNTAIELGEITAATSRGQILEENV
jgi:hypothetical protein